MHACTHTQKQNTATGWISRAFRVKENPVKNLWSIFFHTGDSLGSFNKIQRFETIHEAEDESDENEAASSDDASTSSPELEPLSDRDYGTRGIVVLHHHSSSNNTTPPPQTVDCAS